MATKKSEKQVFYIKDERVYSQKTILLGLPSADFDFEVPHQTKNILVNNKLILEKLEDISKKEGKSLEFGEKIEDFEKIKAKIVDKKEKNELKKPEGEDYDFIEKTSQLEMIKSVVESYNTESFEKLEKNVTNYILNAQKQEKEKLAGLDEEIDIEESKICKLKESRSKYENLEIKPMQKRAKELEIKNEVLEKKKESYKTDFEKSINSDDNDKSKEIENKILKNKHKIINYQHDIKIIETKLAIVKEEIKSGQKKCPNIILMIVTLGLIYWFDFSDCKQKAMRLSKKVSKKKEKILILEQKNYNFEREIEEIFLKNDKNRAEKSKKEENIKSQIEELRVEISKNKTEIESLNKKIIKNQNELQNFDDEIRKIESKLVELDSFKDEYEKYSVEKIKEKLESVKKKVEKELNKLKDLKTNIENQKIEIKGEWIVQIE